MVECRTPEREVRGSKPNAAVLCPWARHFTPRKYWLITQEAMAPSRHDWKIVDWDVKPQHNKTFLKANRKKMAKFTKQSFCKKKQKHFLASNLFRQMFKESILCRRSIKLFQQKLWYKLISPHMHYICTHHIKVAKFDKQPFCQTVFFLHDTSSCTCSKYLYCICKVSESFSKSSGTSWPCPKWPKMCWRAVKQK